MKLQFAKTSETLLSLKGKLSSAHKYLTEQKDFSNSEKIKHLAQKLAAGEFTIAFCGHFSAGKSKMLNALLRDNFLPSSPIPTSANLVRLKHGKDCIKVFFKEGRPKLYLPPCDYEAVKKYCRSGEAISSVEINSSKFTLPPSVVLLDTPGVDSVDAAHRTATESAVYLADLIIYVMDYNHVQSSLNFAFTQQLSNDGKKLCLVINQIDKHAESEISFDNFSQGAKNSFKNWQVVPEKIFYTSMLEKKIFHNEFPEFKAFLKQQFAQKDELLLQSVHNALLKILDDHYINREKIYDSENKKTQESLAKLSPEEKNNLAFKNDALTEKISALQQEIDTLPNVFTNEINKILSNAYLISFELRELAKNYLVSCQSDFKVGFFFSSRKTQAEKKRRLAIFYKELLKRSQSQIEWHIKSFLSSYLKANNTSSPSLLSSIQSFSLCFTDELLRHAVKEGARVSDESVVNYTDDISAEIKRFTRNALESLQTKITEAVYRAKFNVKAAASAKQKTVCGQLAALYYLQSQENKLNAEKKKIMELAENNAAIEENLFKVPQYDFLIQRDFSAAVSDEKMKKIEVREKIPDLPAAAAPIETIQTSVVKLKTMTQKLRFAAKAVENLPGFTQTAAALLAKAHRLSHKGFAVALFGAFSAGKSSFANALIGAKVLPVSPNPMTAAVNFIKPIDKEHPHQSVVVKIKTAENILADLNCALKLFGKNAAALNNALEQIEGLAECPKHETTSAKANLSFLRAFASGYHSFADCLGKNLSIRMEEFPSYVAFEEKSCFVEAIDLYYDCALTREGITLVDTPGADSINARHTDAAFNFIRNADAVLFVTYYNHAFSHTDREFLIQLGRVKDAFALDKMFFIINAIDLAADEEEKTTVLSYVRTQLIKYGIRAPQLNALSSKNALAEKSAGRFSDDSGLAAFEKSFYHFIGEDLTNITLNAAQTELNRIDKLLYKLIDNAKKGSKEKEAEKVILHRQKENIIRLLENDASANPNKIIEQEISELIYYVKQRVFFRLPDFFHESFNPSVLRDNTGNIKQALRTALEEFLNALGFDFTQEMRATALRTERFLEKLMTDYKKQLADDIHTINKEISFTDMEFSLDTSLTFDTAFMDIPREKFAKTLSRFKNAAAFFEKGENEVMQELLEKLLSGFADDYLAAQKEKIRCHYEERLKMEVTALKTAMEQQADNFYCVLLAALEDEKALQNLITAQEMLAHNK